MKSLTIKNFKCFKEKTINFSNLTVLAGGNGAGKSTVIQTLLLFSQSFDGKDLNEHIPEMLYLNDYYCNLGSSKRLLHYNTNDDTIEFIFEDKNNKKIEFITLEDPNDLNILNVVNKDSVLTAHFLTENRSNALNFLKYFDFIGADRFGPRSFHHTDSNFSRINVGKYGEYTALILHSHGGKSLETMKNDLLFNVNFWLTEIFGYVKVITDFHEKANIAMLEVKNHPDGKYESPLNMPYGVSYLLPIIVSCLVRQIPKNELFDDYQAIEEENEMVIIENPEAHLHPSAQSKLGYFLAKMSKYMQIVVETHSEHIINGMRLATLKSDEDPVSNKNISINFFESSESSIEPNIKNIKINEMNDLTDWPRGFFDQQELDISKIFESRMRQ